MSLGKQPLLTALMVAAIGIGVGACMTVMTFVYAMSNDPIPTKSDDLFAVRLDSWDPEEAYWDSKPGEAPWQLTHRDAEALLESPVPVRQAAMFKAGMSVVPDNEDIAPFQILSRMTTRDFFALFEVPFLYGSAWSSEADAAGERVVVLSREINDKLFGGRDSVGELVQFGVDRYRVTGVLDTWQPAVKYYDMNNGPVGDVEETFMPFSLARHDELAVSGNINCWKEEPIDGYFGFLESECVWIQYWAELSSASDKSEYQAWLDAYVGEQKALGRFERPMNNRLSTVTEWMEVQDVTSDEVMVVMSVSLLFLAACLVNTVGLILARFIAKGPVIGLRRALGASKAAIFRQHLVEVGLIGLAGGVLGLLLAQLGLAGVRTILTDAEYIQPINLELLFMTLAIAVGSAIVAGLYPTWRICNLSPSGYLKTQ